MAADWRKNKCTRRHSSDGSEVPLRRQFWRLEQKEEKTGLTVRIVVTFGAVNFSFLVDAKEEFLVGEQFPPAHVSL